MAILRVLTPFANWFFFPFTLFYLSCFVFISPLDFKLASHLDAPLRYYFWMVWGFFLQGFILFIPCLTLLSSLHFSVPKSWCYITPHLSAPPTQEFKNCWVWETSEIFLMAENIGAFSPIFFLFPADMAILGMDIEVQTVEDNVISLEMLFKTWLHDQGTEREQLHLLLPSGGFSHAAAPRKHLKYLISFPLCSPLGSSWIPQP